MTMNATSNDIVLHQPLPTGTEAPIEAPRTAVVISQTPTLPTITYWGRDFDAQAHSSLFFSQAAQLINAGIDQAEYASLMPLQSQGWSGTPMLTLTRDSKVLFPDFRVTNHESTDSSYTFTAEGDDVELSVTLSINSSGLLVQQATITNVGNSMLGVNRLRLAFPVPPTARELLTFTGHHLRERAPQRHNFEQGFFSQESWIGRPGFSSGFLFCAGTPGFDFTHGTVYGVHTAWSGNTGHFAERTAYTHGLLGGEELLYPGEIELNPGESYTSPRLIGSWGEGLTELSSRFHHYLRRVHANFRTGTRRPITLNTWEAVYFQQKPQTLTSLASMAADMGIERFVVDDGWFRGRHDDFAALGDWEVDYDVWPDGLAPLADHVHANGMEFGLWFEPEMISLNSDLARAHADWILRANNDRLPLPGRHEYVLDLANPQAFAYILDHISTLVEQVGIDYIKWDHNRFITEAISPYTGRPAVHDQTLAYYQLVRQLHEKFPELAIENCASGGGRVDLQISELTHSVWTSDCTDPIERADIQRYTSLLLPPEMLGAHISASPSHQTGRTTTLTTRTAVAFPYGFGFELDLTQLSDLDRWLSGEWVTLHKEAITEPMQSVHGDTIDPAVRVDGVVSQDKTYGLFTICQLASSADYPIRPVALPGLRSDLMYRVRPFGGAKRYEDSDVAGRPAPQWWNDEGTLVPGQVLATWGIRSKHIFPNNAVMIEVQAV
ncbi:alpha-galactosidase [Arcanobacterium phocae]|uniref:alpha-galactosidase n=3 Tax=Arcanobacterium phocae TaxID=131112 RepID=UPI00209D4D49|nr:alpha-galactosidase [Arcanobacterium phocae]